MDVTIQAAIIGAVFTFFAALATILASYLRERSERQKWHRTLQLEERRIRHEELKWALDLNNQREIELHRMRLRTYPKVFELIVPLSRCNIFLLDKERIEKLANQFNEIGYGEAGICMLPDTREAVFTLRDALFGLARKEVSAEDVMRGPRTDLAELLRRDSNHDWSPWRQFKTLIDANRERIQKITSDDSPK